MRLLSEVKRVCGVYVITNTVNGKVYVGSAANISNRVYRHRYDLKRGRHHSPILQRAWVKHGPEAFVLEVVEVTLVGNLIQREQAWLDKLQSFGPNKGYNIAKCAGSPTRGRPLTAEHKSKLSAFNKGRKMSEEVIAMRRAFRHTSESRAKIGAAHRGKVISEETRARLVASHTGKKRSAESIAKFVATQKGHKVSAETRARIGAKHRGLRHTAEAKAKISAAFKGRPWSLARRAAYEACQGRGA